MRDYAQISPRFWTGDTGKQLRGHQEAQIVALYLMSAPGSHMIGMYPLELPTLCHHTGLTLQGARKGLARLSEVGFAVFDEPGELVWVPEMARFQIGDRLKRGDNRIRGVEKELENYRKSKFFNAFIDKYGADFCLQIEREKPQAPLKPLPSQEQEQEQDQDQEQEQEQKNLPVVASDAGGDRAEGRTVPTRLAYESAFRERWNHDPLKGKTINGQLAKFVGLVGQQDAPAIAAFYVRHNQALYVNAKHPVNLLLRDAQKLATEWASGEAMTGTQARQIERTQANHDGWSSMLKEKSG